MTTTDLLIDVMDTIGDVLIEIDVPADQHDAGQLQVAIHRLDISLHDLADRLRAAGVNNKPVKFPPSKQVPKPPPPPKNPPSPKPGKGR